MSRWRSNSYTKAGPVTIQHPGEEPEEQPAYSSREHGRIVAAGRRGEREHLLAHGKRPTNAQVRRGDVPQAASGETEREA